MLCHLFYFGSVVLVGLFVYLGLTGNKGGANWQGGLLVYALLFVFWGLLGDVVCDIAERRENR